MDTEETNNPVVIQRESFELDRGKKGSYSWKFKCLKSEIEDKNAFLARIKELNDWALDQYGALTE